MRSITAAFPAVSEQKYRAVIFFGKGGDIATNRRDEQELSMLCLRVLQAALVYVNTLMVQDVLASEEWTAALTDADRRGLTPLFWTHAAPYGEVRLDMSRRLQLSRWPPSSGGCLRCCRCCAPTTSDPTSA